MSEHDLEKLLGGFAADTLMPEERIRLYTAAMQDQPLFNALADEQTLKELLADPLVRTRLLAALKQTGTLRASGSLSWWDWFRRPAGLAIAGGLAAAVFAVAFGTKIYLEGIDRTAQSVATEDTTPAAQQAPVQRPSSPARLSEVEPQVGKEGLDSVSKPAKKDAPTERLAERKSLVAPSLPQEERAERDDARIQGEKRPGTPPAAPLSQAPQAPTGAPLSSTGLPTTDARSLFYGSEPGKEERVAVAGKAAGSVAPLKPLGLRYSFVIQGNDGQDKEVDIPTAAHSTGRVRISVEANQDAYLQILQTLGTAGTRLWWPPQETGKISLKVIAGRRSEIPLPPPAESGLLSLIVRLSPKPFAPLTMQEVGMLDRFAANLLIESVSPGGTGAQEQATYVVSQDSSPTAQMTVEISIRQSR
ncbi:MAG: hypothetical protein H0V35_12600 [Nitrospira sp.]|nr:hypothetical protein [Nitrospira sp.]